MNRIRRSRLALSLFVLFSTVWLVATGQWLEIANLPSALESQIRRANFEAYAASKGTTPERIAQDFYDQQVEANNKARAAGQHECSYWSSAKNCYLPAIHGTPARQVEIGLDDVLEGMRRTAAKSAPLVIPFAGSMLAALFIIYGVPALVSRYWAWLAPGH
jgi:hypothetical protein